MSHGNASNHTTRDALLAELHARAVDGLFTGELRDITARAAVNHGTAIHVLRRLIRDGVLTLEQRATRTSPWRLRLAHGVAPPSNVVAARKGVATPRSVPVDHSGAFAEAPAATADNRLRRVAPKTFPASEFSMLGGRI